MQDNVYQVDESLENESHDEETEMEEESTQEEEEESEMEADGASMPDKRPASRARRGKSKKRGAPLPKPKHLPTTLVHPDKPSKFCSTLEEWRAAKDAGYKRLNEWPEDIAAALHLKGQDPGLHASQKQRS